LRLFWHRGQPDPIKAAASERRVDVGFWLLGVILVAYVWGCTGQRDNLWRADAWEHHRAIVALTEKIWKPGNPTFATEHPSIRYSPYSVLLALVSRWTRCDPYDVLSGAAAVNTLLLVLGVRYLLGSFGEARLAGYVLVIMVGLYGQAPGYAGSYALSDLPWHQVNPSAFSFALTLFVWGRYKRGLGDRASPPDWLLLVVLSAVVILTHPMTGFFMVIGMATMGWVASCGKWRTLQRLVIMQAAAAALCVAWPWYDFADALLVSRDTDFWFNDTILKRMLTSWCAPALLLSLWTLPFRRRPLVRFCLAGALVCYVLGVSGYVVRSATFARIPLVGIICLHIPIAVFAHESGLFRLSTWPARLHGLLSRPERGASPETIEVALFVVLVYCLAPQLGAVVREPHLARAYVAPLIGRENKQLDLKKRFDELLTPVGAHDVVLSDMVTSWVIPSSRGRIVGALHFEYFVPDGSQRQQDVEAFFSEADNAQRKTVLERYNVRWIVLNKENLPPDIFDALYDGRAVVRSDRSLSLMDANIWLENSEATTVGDIPRPLANGWDENRGPLLFTRVKG